MLALAGGIFAAISLTGVRQAHAGLPLADMAKNAWLGLELTRDVRALAPFELLRHLNAHDVWPFGFSLMLVPSYLVFGESFAAATLVSTLCFALLPAGLLALAREVDRGAASLAGALLAATLVVASPLAGALSIQILRETAGMLLLVVGAALYLRAARRDTLGAWRLAGAALLALFLIKYNYALFLLPAAIVDRAVQLPAARRRALAEAARSAVERSRTPRAPGFWVATSAIVLLASLGLRLSPGTVLFGLLVSWSIVLAVLWRSLGRRVLTSLRSLPPDVRAVIETFVVPVWIWCLGPSPMHARALVDFLANRDSGLGILAGTRFYLDALVREVVPGAAVAAGLALGLALAAASRPRAARLRLLALLAMTTVALPLVHPYKLPRFLITALPPLALLGGLGWAWATARLADRIGAARWAPLAPLAACVAMLAALEVPARGFAAEGLRLASGPPSVRPTLSALADIAPDRGRTAIVGSSNELSLELAWWELSRHHGRQLVFVRSPPQIAAEAPTPALEQHVERWLRRRRPDFVLAISTDTSSPRRRDGDYRRYRLWQESVVEVIARDVRWEELARERVEAAELEIVLYGRRATDGGG